MARSSMNAMARRKKLGRYAPGFRKKKKNQPAPAPQPPGVPPQPPAAQPPGVPPQPTAGPGTNRAIKDPEKAFGALNKLKENLSPEKRKQLEMGVNNIFGGNITGQINQDQAAQTQNLFGQTGIAGPGNPAFQAPPPPPAPAQTPVRVSDPSTFQPAAPSAPQVMGQPSLNPGDVQGTMGMQAPAQSPPTLGQTVEQQQLAKKQQWRPPGEKVSNAQGTPSATQTAAPGGVNNNLDATANKSPAISSNTTPAPALNNPALNSGGPSPPPNYGTGSQFGAGGALGPGVSTGQLQSAITGSNMLNTGPATAGQIFQAQYNPLINMAGKTDIMNQLSTPGRSNVGGQYGTGGLANIAQQTAANQAAMQGTQGAQGLISGNVQQQMGAQQLASQFDITGRQQQIQHQNAMLQPALAGVASGFGQAIQGMNKMPQFLG